MRTLIGGSIVTGLVMVALGGATLANAATPSTGFAARAASAVTQGSLPGPIESLSATPFASIAPTVEPSLSGIGEVDTLLTADPGTWPGTELAYSYQWFDCDPTDPASCSVIPNARASEYGIQPSDGGSTIVVQVNATDGSGDTGSATSAPTAVVTARPGAPVVLSAPAIGSIVGGEPVTATVGTWSGSPTRYTDWWYDCPPTISDPSSISELYSSCAVADWDVVTTPATSSYTPTLPGDVLVFVVIASGAGGDSVETVSAPSARVTFAPPTVSIITPASTTYAAPLQLVTNYSCTAPPMMELVSCTGTVPSGSSLFAGFGAHQFTVTATDLDGQTATETVTYSVPWPVPAAPGSSAGDGSTAVGSPLSVTSLSQSSTKWRAGNALPGAVTAHAASHAPGTRFSFVANHPATITYTFSRLVAGRVRGKACVAATRANRRAKACTRSLPSEVMTLPAVSGANVVSFQGRLNATARLRPGRYCVTVAAQATTGPAIQVGTLHFTIVK